jgi:hypothetical protein
MQSFFKSIWHVIKLIYHILLQLLLILMVWTLGLGTLFLAYLFVKIKDFIIKGDRIR